MPLQKILYVIGSLDLGGAERHVSLISPRLKQLGWEPIIYCITRRGIQSDGVEKNGVRVIGPPWEIGPGQMPFGKLVRMVASCIKLFGLLLFQRPQIVHFFLPLAYVIGAPLAFLARSPILIMSRRSLNLYQRQHPVLSRLEMWLHRRMDAILGNSRAVVDQLVELEGCSRDKVSIIYNGIDVASIDRVEATDDTSISKPSVLVFIIVANLIHYKGHSDLIEAFAIVQQRLPERWSLLCIGRDDGIRAKLEIQTQKLNLASHVHFLGERTDVASLLKLADIGILCSHQEGFANAILEGMAAGLPMVATDVGGNAEAVVHGQTGLIVAPHDPAALGAAILELASNALAREQMGSAARRRVEERFSMDQCVSHYDDFYHAVTRTHHADEREDSRKPREKIEKLRISQSLRLFGIIAVTCVTFGIALSAVDLSAVWSATKHLSPVPILGAGGLLLLGILLATVRFRYMASDIGHALSPRDAMLALGVGQIAGALTVQYFGQIAARSTVLAPRGFSPPANIFLATYERLTAAVVSVILAVAGSWYLFGNIAINLQTGGNEFLKIAAGLFVTVVAAATLGWGRAALMAIPRQKTGKIFISLTRNLLLSLAIQACTVTAYVIIALSLSPAIPLNNIFAASAVVAFAASLPISFSGWGVRELSAMLVLGIVGIQSETALAIAVLIGILALAVAASLAAAALLIPRKHAPYAAIQWDTVRQINIVTAVQCGIPLIAATAVYFQIHLPVRTTLVNVNLADPLAILGGALFLLYYVIRKSSQWRLVGLTSHVLIVTAVMIFAFLHGLQSFGWSDWAFNNKLLGWFVLLCYAATGALIVKSRHDGLSLFVRTFVATAVGVILLDLALLLVDSLIIKLPVGFVSLPIVGFSQNRNALGFILVLAICGLTIMSRRSRPWILGILLSGLWFAGSRAAFGAVTVVLILAVIMRALTGREIALGVAIGAGTIIVIPSVQFIIALFGFKASLIALFGVKASSRDFIDWVIQLSPESSDNERFTSISDGIKIFFSHPIFGAGLGAFVKAQLELGQRIVVIHSTPVWLLAETGLIGFFAFAVPAVRIFWKEWSEPNKDAAGRMLILIMVTFGIVSLAHEILHQRAFWLLLGAALAYLPSNMWASDHRTDPGLTKLPQTGP